MGYAMSSIDASAPTQTAPSASGWVEAPNPAALAIARVSDARNAIQQTITFLSPGTKTDLKKVWRNFGEPKDMPFDGLGEFSPIKSDKDFLAAISSHYQRMLGTLGKAQSLFHGISQAIVGKDAYALTLTNDRVASDPPDKSPYPPGIYFASRFAACTDRKKTEIVIHEVAHFKDGHHFSDAYSPYGPNWGKFSGKEGILNAWSYSMLVLDVVFNRATPFPDPP